MKVRSAIQRLQVFDVTLDQRLILLGHELVALLCCVPVRLRKRRDIVRIRTLREQVAGDLRLEPTYVLLSVGFQILEQSLLTGAVGGFSLREQETRLVVVHARTHRLAVRVVLADRLSAVQIVLRFLRLLLLLPDLSLLGCLLVAILAGKHAGHALRSTRNLAKRLGHLLDLRACDVLHRSHRGCVELDKRRRLKLWTFVNRDSYHAVYPLGVAVVVAPAQHLCALVE